MSNLNDSVVAAPKHGEDALAASIDEVTALLEAEKLKCAEAGKLTQVALNGGSSKEEKLQKLKLRAETAEKELMVRRR